MEDIKAFKTKDTALASYLKAKGMEILGTVPHPNYPGAKEFVFLDSPERDELVQRYLSGDDMVSASHYARTYKIVKRYIYEENSTEPDIQG